MYQRLVSTYESGSTRRFRLGRVENIRGATVQALNLAKFIKTSCDPNGKPITVSLTSLSIYMYVYTGVSDKITEI